MRFFEIYISDITSNMRVMEEKIKNHFFIFIWFILLAMTAAWLGLKVAEYIIVNNLYEEFYGMKESNILMAFFLIFMGKSMIDSNYLLVESRELEFIAPIPMNILHIFIGKMLVVTVQNLGTTAIILVIITAIKFTAVPLLYISWHYIAAIIILSILSSIIGFNFSIINSWSYLKRFVFVFIYGQIIAFIYLSIDFYGVVSGAIPFLLAGIPLSLVALPLLRKDFFEMWNKQISSEEVLGVYISKRHWEHFVSLIEKFFGERIAILIKKEILINIQKKEVWGTLMAIVGISLLLIYFQGKITEIVESTLPVFKIVTPVLVSIGIYMSCVLQHALLGLGSISKEGKRLWIVQSLPVRSKEIFYAKSISLLIFSPLIVFLVAVPLPIISNMGIEWAIFFAISSIALSFAYTGIGVWAGVKYPNFSEEMGGTADIITMYIVMMICMICGAMMIGIPGYIMAKNFILGIFLALFSVEWGILICVILVRRSVEIYEKIEYEVF